MLALTLALLCGAEPGVLDPFRTPAGLPRFEVERRLGDAGVVTGLVTDDDGKPLEGVTVWLYERRGSGAAKSGKDGTFALQVKPGGRAADDADKVVLSLPGYAGLEGTLSDVLTPRFVRARLARAVRFSAKVAFPEAVPSLSLRSADMERRWYVSGYQALASAADGGFTFAEDLAPGDYEVSVGYDRFRVRLPATNVILRPPTGRIEGTARKEPPGASNHAYVQASEGTYNPGRGGQLQVAADGTFVYEQLPPGRWTLRISSQCAVQTVVVDGGTARVHFDDGPGWGLRGRILEPDGRPPREAVWVRGSDYNCSIATQTGKDGFFSFDGIDPGVSAVKFWVARLGPKDRRRWENHSGGPDRAINGPILLEFEASPDAGLVQLTLPRPLPPRVISGKVVDAAGKPLAGVLVDGHGVPARLHPAVKTNARGEFRLKAPFEEALRNVTFEKEGFVTATQHESAVKRVTLAPEPKLRVRLLDASQQPLPGVHDLAVRYVDEAGADRWQRWVVREGEEGVFEPPLGSFVVQASLNDGRALEQPVDAGTLDVVLLVP